MNLIDWGETLKYELRQLEEQGIDLASLPDHVKSAAGSQDESEAKCRDLYGSRASWRRTAGFPYEEPSDLPSIIAASNFHEARDTFASGGESLFDRIYGAWLGRAAG